MYEPTDKMLVRQTLLPVNELLNPPFQLLLQVFLLLRVNYRICTTSAWQGDQQDVTATAKIRCVPMQCEKLSDADFEYCSHFPSRDSIAECQTLRFAFMTLVGKRLEWMSSRYVCTWSQMNMSN